MVPRKRCFRLASVRLGEAQYLMNSDGRIGYDSAELEMNVLHFSPSSLSVAREISQKFPFHPHSLLRSFHRCFEWMR